MASRKRLSAFRNSTTASIQATCAFVVTESSTATVVVVTIWPTGFTDCKNINFERISESSLVPMHKPKSLLLFEPAMYRYTWLMLWTFCSTLHASSTSLHTIKQITSCSDHSVGCGSSGSPLGPSRSVPHALRLIPFRALFWGVSSRLLTWDVSCFGLSLPQFWQMQFRLQGSPALAQKQVARSLFRHDTSREPWTVRFRTHLRNPHLHDKPDCEVGLFSQLKHWHAMHGTLAIAHGHLLSSWQNCLVEGLSVLYLNVFPHLHLVLLRAGAVISI